MGVASIEHFENADARLLTRRLQIARVAVIAQVCAQACLRIAKTRGRVEGLAGTARLILRIHHVHTPLRLALDDPLRLVWREPGLDEPILPVLRRAPLAYRSETRTHRASHSLDAGIDQNALVQLCDRRLIRVIGRRKLAELFLEP